MLRQDTAHVRATRRTASSDTYGEQLVSDSRVGSDTLRPPLLLDGTSLLGGNARSADAGAGGDCSRHHRSDLVHLRSVDLLHRRETWFQFEPSHDSVELRHVGRLVVGEFDTDIVGALVEVKKLRCEATDLFDQCTNGRDRHGVRKWNVSPAIGQVVPEP